MIFDLYAVVSHFVVKVAYNLIGSFSQCLSFCVVCVCNNCHRTNQNCRSRMGMTSHLFDAYDTFSSYWCFPFHLFIIDNNIFHFIVSKIYTYIHICIYAYMHIYIYWYMHKYILCVYDQNCALLSLMKISLITILTMMVLGLISPPVCAYFHLLNYPLIVLVNCNVMKSPNPFFVSVEYLQFPAQKLLQFQVHNF